MSPLIVRIAAAAIGLLAIGCSGSTGPKQAATPAAIISIDTGTVMAGGIVPVSIRLTRTEGDGPKLDSLSSFEFRICYDRYVLGFVNADKGPTISQWEYFTYRSNIASPYLAGGLNAVEIVATRDINDGNPPDLSQSNPSGVLVTMHFYVGEKAIYQGTRGRIGFWLVECQDNTLTPVSNGGIVYAPDTMLSEVLDETGYDSASCPHITRSPVLRLQGGWLQVAFPPQIQPGDVDLDGVAFEVHDAVLFSDYFYNGYPAFDRATAAGQIAATDCDGDGEPLTRADLRVMIRSITGEDPGGDSLNVPYMDTLWIFPKQVADHWILSLRATTKLDELWLQIADSTAGSFDIRELPYSLLDLSVYRSEQTVWVAYGTQDGRLIFGPELGDRFEIHTSNGKLNIVAAQASRYPGVAMKVRVLLPH